MSNDLQRLQRKQEEFIQSRDWEQFHTPKSIAMAISIEANELLELFQWHDNLSAAAYEDRPEIQTAVEEELADVLIYVLSMASVFEIDLDEAVAAKLEANSDRFDEANAAAIRRDLAEWQRSESGE